MANRNSFKKGTIELLLLLSILRVEDCYGYQITQKIKEQSEGAITVTEGALYPILYKLSDKGYVSDYKKLVGKRLTRVYYHRAASIWILCWKIILKCRKGFGRC